MIEPTSAQTPEDVVAKAGTYYRNARFILVALVLGAGIAFAYDGFVRYPNYLAQFNAAPPQEQAAMTTPHSDLDITIQRLLAIALVPMAGFMLAFFLHRSRGEYRLSPTTLTVPGHPPVPLECIIGLDKSKWERKRIAYIDYEIPGSKPRRLKLDDFIYQEAPTDRIVQRIETYLNPENAATADGADRGDQASSGQEVS